jgi:hypothetical protein
MRINAVLLDAWLSLNTVVSLLMGQVELKHEGEESMI